MAGGRWLRFLALCTSIVIVLSACAPLAPTATAAAEPTSAAAATVVPAAPTPTPAESAAPARPGGLTAAESAALASLRKVGGYPLYTMTYTGTIETVGVEPATAAGFPGAATWACSLFAALADPQAGLFGRNFDWTYSPALLLFTDPPDGYASVSMVDMAYLDLPEEKLQDLAALPVEQRRGLLEAVRLPFDGLNEHGLAVGMAAVPPGDMRPDPAKATLGSLEIIREVLDHARTVEEAVALFEQYNVTMEEVPIHYLLADAQGQAVLIEYYRGQMAVFPNQGPYHLATNFLLAEGGGEPAGQHGRYERMSAALQAGGGSLAAEAAMRLLAEVSQPNTQWSVVYELHAQRVQVALGREYDEVFSFSLGDINP